MKYFLYAKKIKITTFFQQFVFSLSLLVTVTAFKRKRRLCTEHNAMLASTQGCAFYAYALIWMKIAHPCIEACYFYFLCLQKVFSSLHKIQIEPLIADGLPWQCFLYFSGPRQCYILGSQWASHKPPGFYLKYLKLCSEDEQSFYGVGTTCG